MHVDLFKGINKQQLQEYTSNPNANRRVDGQHLASTKGCSANSAEEETTMQ